MLGWVALVAVRNAAMAASSLSILLGGGKIFVGLGQSVAQLVFGILLTATLLTSGVGQAVSSVVSQSAMATASDKAVWKSACAVLQALAERCCCCGALARSRSKGIGRVLNEQIVDGVA